MRLFYLPFYVILFSTTWKWMETIYICGICNPFKPKFTIVIFIHYKPRIAVALMWVKKKIAMYW